MRASVGRRRLAVAAAIVLGASTVEATLLSAALWGTVGGSGVAADGTRRPAPVFRGGKWLPPGRPVNLGKKRDHPVVINFWRIPCERCEKEKRELARVKDMPVPVEVVGVALATENQWDAAVYWAQEFRPGIPNVVDVNRQIRKAYRLSVNDPPVTYVVGIDGLYGDPLPDPLSFDRLREAVCEAYQGSARYRRCTR